MDLRRLSQLERSPTAGLHNAIVSLTDQQGVRKTVMTSSNGFFRFDDVEAGQTYVLAVASRRFQFTPRIISVTDDLTDIDFVAAP